MGEVGVHVRAGAHGLVHPRRVGDNVHGLVVRVDGRVRGGVAAGHLLAAHHAGDAQVVGDLETLRQTLRVGRGRHTRHRGLGPCKIIFTS